MPISLCSKKNAVCFEPYFVHGNQPNVEFFENKISNLVSILHMLVATMMMMRKKYGILKVVREHNPLGRDVELFRRHRYSPGKVGPAVKGSRGAELVDGLVIREGDYKLVKTRFSAFFATHLHSFLQGAGVDSLIDVM